MGDSDNYTINCEDVVNRVYAEMVGKHSELSGWLPDSTLIQLCMPEAGNENSAQVRIVAAAAFSADWIREKYAKAFANSFSKYLGKEHSVEVEVIYDSKRYEQSDLFPEEEEQTSYKIDTRQDREIANALRKCNVPKNFSQSYFPHEGNRWAVATFDSVYEQLENEVGLDGSMLLIGPPGTGKTSLIVDTSRKLARAKCVPAYVHVGDDIVRAFSRNNGAPPNLSYVYSPHTCVVFIDEINNVVGSKGQVREATAEQVKTLIDFSMKKGFGPIISFTGERHNFSEFLMYLKEGKESLASRLEGAGRVFIGKPRGNRKEFVLNLLEAYGFGKRKSGIGLNAHDLEAIAEIIAEKASQGYSVRQFEGDLRTLRTFLRVSPGSSLQEAITTSLGYSNSSQMTFSYYSSPAEKKPVSVSEVDVQGIVKSVLENSGLTANAFLGKGRTRELVDARKEVTR